MIRQKQYGSMTFTWILMLALVCALSVGNVVSARPARHAKRFAGYSIDPTYGLPLPKPAVDIRHYLFHLDRLRLDFKYYPVKYRGAFACSDPLLTKIWYTGAYTAHLCMQEQIWDGPKRDRRLWMGDLQISGQTINNVFLNP